MELVPQPLAHLLRRIVREHEPAGAVFDLPLAKAWQGSGRDLSRRFHRQRASTPVGPAAGPHTQLAQNIALSYLAGGRIFELKTVQINDRLQIPRPCIDATNVGFNVEWSQELRISESKEEYAKAALLIAALRRLGLPGGLDLGRDGDFLFDLSLGYDLAGIQSPAISGFITSMLDASDTLERLRSTLPHELAAFRDLEVAPRLVDCVTLSTFHGCPAEEIELIAKHLMETYRLHMVVKLNPTLLGFDQVQSILHDQLGYTELSLRRANFEKDLQWTQALEIIGRLRSVAARVGVDFGVKLTNTMIVDNHKTFFRDQEMYLSGQPLHVLSTQLLARLRSALPLVGPGQEPPIMYTFSAGIDQHNFPGAVAADLCPVTVCTDLLRPGGYARLPKYLDGLAAELDRVGASDVEHYVLSAHGEAETAMVEVIDAVLQLATRRGLKTDAGTPAKLREAAARLTRGEGTIEACLRKGGVSPELAALVHPLWIHQAGTRNARRLAADALADPRYAKTKNNKMPKKIGSSLALFDCVSCDKCVPVCPNDANFAYQVSPAQRRAPTWVVRGARLEASAEVVLEVREAHQLATFVDFCNACGNCDVFCPEDGGPYNMKPHWFGSERSFAEGAPLDGFYLPSADHIVGRIGGALVQLEVDRPRGEATYREDGAMVKVSFAADPLALLDSRLDAAHEGQEIRGDRILILAALLDGVQATVNPVSAALAR